jgi:anti-sigma-K factor RskA
MSSLMQDQDLDRLSELLAEEAALGLGVQELEELNALLPDAAHARRQMMEAAALAQLALLKRDSRGSRPMPAQLRARLAAMGQAQVAASVRPAPRPVTSLAAERQRRQDAANATQSLGGSGTARTWHRNPAIGWSVAAALALAVVVFRVQDAGGPPGLAAPDDRQALLADPATVTLPWSPPTEAGYEGVRGEVVWNGQRQAGYLRLTGMPVNDPASAQYQLWIVDPSRDRQHPVDGGVFNVAASGEVIVPIDAKLPITAPVAFAITLEQPGGVVVSAGPLLVVAARS